MSFSAPALAAQKHQETKHPEAIWLKVIESADQSLRVVGVAGEDIEKLALASRSPEKFVLLTRLLYQFGKTRGQGEQVSATLLHMVSQSPYSLADWIDSIEIFHTWLQNHQRKADFHSMLQYLECCVASPDSKERGQKFSALVEDMLLHFGFDGGKP